MPSIDEFATFFDSPLRSTEEEIEKTRKIISENPLIAQFLEGFPNLAVILDKNRQIVAFNRNAEKLLNKSGNGGIFGKRVGEVVGCIHSTEMPAGCGTSKFCSECGAGRCNKFTGEFLENNSEECRITIRENNIESALDLRVFTSVLKVDGKSYTLFSIEDIQDEKRREVLEKIFFHDVLNTASTIQGIAGILKETENKNEMREFNEHLAHSAEQLVNEIKMQQNLVSAERGSLELNIELKPVKEILSRAFNLFKDKELARGKNYILELPASSVIVETDDVLLIRSLSNLIKNALEATSPEGTVRVSAEKKGESVFFYINNDSVIPANYQLQIFQRSFSTKGGTGRGIGTYSVKLLVENYLNGEVSFTSSEVTGTTFCVSVPLEFGM